MSASDEPLRQRYLAALGITPWLPTRVLPGAAPSPRWQWQALTPPAAQSAARPVAAPPRPATTERGPTKPPIDLRALLADPPAASGAPGKASSKTSAQTSSEASTKAATKAATTAISGADPAAAAPRVAPAAVPRFRLLLSRYADCLVLNDLPLDASQPVTPQHQRLLAAILAAVGLGREPQGAHVLSWPLLAVDSGHDQGPAVARMMLRLEAGFDQLPAGLPLLLLGEQAAQHLVDEGQYGGPLVRGPSLNEMLRIPSRKAELWRALQPLRRG